MVQPRSSHQAPQAGDRPGRSVIYLDNNATTGLDGRVLDAMLPFYRELAGNPSSRHQLGRRARQGLENARRQVAAALNTTAGQILFTSGATEANNWVIQSASRWIKQSSAGATDSEGLPTVVVSQAEHPSCLEPARTLRDEGFDVVELGLDAQGQIKGFADAITEQTRLVILQLANGETGVIQPVAELVKHCPPGCWIHCDAVQAMGKITVDPQALGVSTLTISGHKMHGPPGIGVLWRSQGLALSPMMRGGAQQGDLRPGTEALALAVGLGEAVRLAADELTQRHQLLSSLRDKLEEGLRQSLGDVIVNGGGDRLPNASNMSFLGTNAQALLMALDLSGVCCSAGSACSSGSLEPSPVLRAMGLEGDPLTSALRFAVSIQNTPAEIDRAIDAVTQAVKHVRQSVS